MNMTSEEFMVEKVSGMQEDDATRQQRLIDLFDLYKRNSTAEVVDRIQNLLSTCLKLLVSEVDVQNNVTIGYMSFLTKTHMVLAVIKRDWNTLQSLVKQAPGNPAYLEYFCTDYLMTTYNCDFGTQSHHDILTTAVVYNILMRMLKSETFAPELIKVLSSLLEKSNEKVRMNFMRAFELGQDMIGCVDINVNYYMIAKMFHDVNLNKSSTLKLLCMGLANDCTRLDNLRFNIDIHKNRVYDVNELFHRMSQVLVFMSKIVFNKNAKLKCLAAAKTVADKKLVDSLATVKYKRCYDRPVQDDAMEDSLMNQLEFFAMAIYEDISYREYYSEHKFISS